jgi:hypothetical protein
MRCRQIITVNENTKFSLDIPLVDFNQLAFDLPPGNALTLM